MKFSEQKFPTTYYLDLPLTRFFQCRNSPIRA